MKLAPDPCVYLITNLVNGKRYVGKTVRPTKRWYWHVVEARKDQSCMLIAKAIKKYGPDKFRFEILEHLPTEDAAFEREIWWIQHFQSDHSGIGYNLESGGLGGRVLGDSTRQKISAARKGWSPSTKTRQRMAAAQRGKKRSPEAIEKTATSNRGVKRSPEVIARASQARVWNGHTPESRAKMSAAKLGKKQSPDLVEKRAASNRGKKRSLESSSRMSLAQKERRAREASA